MSGRQSRNENLLVKGKTLSRQRHGYLWTSQVGQAKSGSPMKSLGKSLFLNSLRNRQSPQSQPNQRSQWNMRIMFEPRSPLFLTVSTATKIESRQTAFR